MMEQWKERLEAVRKQAMPLVLKYRAVLIVLLAGVLLLASAGHGSDEPENSAPSAVQDTADFDLTSFEQQLCGKLAAVDGVGRVELMLSLEQSGEAVYAVNTRQTSSGGDSASFESDLTVVSDSSYGEAPVTVKNLLPTFRGAVVLCDGAGDANVRLAVTQAVSTVCGIGADKVTVLKLSGTS